MLAGIFMSLTWAFTRPGAFTAAAAARAPLPRRSRRAGIGKCPDQRKRPRGAIMNVGGWHAAGHLHRP
ncbi:hypothetical protein Ae168Ps1_6104c [Pseudonocardia sp. Ae168_Ps1]|nr:hypothetical protein Ae150APs1_6037c [Pseudonocardia sp. Ae150A_Ps1]OLL70639.1 hypothetical protein Ae168Ps1_6104c [Pseudonocardia sp. Ae168_Ps1]